MEGAHIHTFKFTEILEFSKSAEHAIGALLNGRVQVLFSKYIFLIISMISNLKHQDCKINREESLPWQNININTLRRLCRHTSLLYEDFARKDQAFYHFHYNTLYKI